MSDDNDKNADNVSTAQVRVTALSSTMFYTAGRIDAADRRAGSVIALALGLLGLSVGTGRLELAATGCELATQLAENLSSLAALISLVLALFGVWARLAQSDDWVSQNFLGKTTPQELSRKMAESEDGVLLGMIASQQELSKLVRQKNLLSNLAILLLITASILFALGF